MAKTPTLSQIENAFQPAREADVPERFAGRAKAVEECLYALITSGANIAIVGNRGIGKSSLARQLIHMANGENTLLEKLGLPASERNDFVTMYMACGDSIGSTGELLERILTKSDCLGEWLYDIPKARSELEGYKPKITAGVVGLQGEKQTRIDSERAISEHNIEVVFLHRGRGAGY